MIGFYYKKNYEKPNYKKPRGANLGCDWAQGSSVTFKLANFYSTTLKMHSIPLLAQHPTT